MDGTKIEANANRYTFVWANAVKKNAEKLYQKIELFVKILRENGYVNVKYLWDEIGYSKATINRDLNYMVKQKLIVRSYGGVELIEKQDIPLAFRYHKMKKEKKRICKAAAELVKDGDVILLIHHPQQNICHHILLTRMI